MNKVVLLWQVIDSSPKMSKSGGKTTRMHRVHWSGQYKNSLYLEFENIFWENMCNTPKGTGAVALW